MRKYGISRIPHRISKILFVLGSYESLAMLAHFFKVQSGKITVWYRSDKRNLGQINMHRITELTHNHTQSSSVGYAVSSLMFSYK